MSQLRNWCLTYNIPDDDYKNSDSVPAESICDANGDPAVEGAGSQSHSDVEVRQQRRDDGARDGLSPLLSWHIERQRSVSPGQPSVGEGGVSSQSVGDGGREVDPYAVYSSFITSAPKLRFAIWQLECAPTSGQKHIQGYLEFTSSMRLSAVKRFLSLPTCHLEGRRGSRQQAISYCGKEETRLAGPWQIGDSRISPGKRSDLSEVTDRILSGKPLADLVEEYPNQYVRYRRGIEALYGQLAHKRQSVWRDVTVLVYWGDTGTGKTRLALGEGEVPFFVLDQGDRIWFDGYTGQPRLVIDDFYGWIKYGVLLRILDGHPYRCEIKGGFFPALWTEVVITSNKHPSDWYSAGLTAALERRLTEIRHFSTLVN